MENSVMERMAFREALKKSQGFTLIEIIAVLVVIGIIAAVAAMGMREGNSAAIVEADSLASGLRYAQGRAMGDVNLWGVLVETDGFTIRKKSNISPYAETDEIMPGEETKHLFKSPATATSGTGTFWFDFRGRPVDSDGALHSGDQSIVITGNSAVTVTITEETGFIE